MQMSFFAPTRTHDGVALRSSYHVRGKVQGPAAEVAAEVKRGEVKASRQDTAVLAAFNRNKGAAGPSVVWKDVNFRRFLEGDGQGKDWPLTSIRRAMSNLTKRGLLRMLPERSEGLFGEPEHLWELTEKGKR